MLMDKMHGSTGGFTPSSTAGIARVYGIIPSLRLNPPTPPNMRYSPLWYIIIYWEYFVLVGVGGFNVRRRGFTVVYQVLRPR